LRVVKKVSDYWILGILVIIQLRIFCPQISSNDIRIKICKATILPVLYTFETCSFFLREGSRMRMFQSRDLGRWA
jgi:hypothetical protein